MDVAHFYSKNHSTVCSSFGNRIDDDLDGHNR
jgi:hypothetical protein